MARIVVFGNGVSASLVHFYLSHDSDHEVVAFTVDRGHADASEFRGLPLVAFDEVADRYPPGQHEMIVAIGYLRTNAFRAERYGDAKALGYRLASYVSSRASVWPDAQIGDNCIIAEDVTIQPFVRIGDDVTVYSAAHVGHSSCLGDHAFVASHAVLCGGVSIGERSFIGVNSTVADGVRVGRENVIGAGALVETDTADRAVYTPARTIRLPMTSDRLPSI